MIRNTLNLLSPFGIAAMLFIGVAPCLAQTEPETSAETQDAASEAQDAASEAQEAPPERIDDDAFAKSFLGKPYTETLSIDGWTDIGGGLVSPPIYVHQYQREDGTFLILTAKETGPANYEVTDALLVSKPKRGAALTIACTKGEDYTLRFIAVARGSENAERWTRIDRAWEIELETGKILDTKGRGVKCENPTW